MTDLLQPPTDQPTLDQINIDALAADLVKTRSHEELAKKAIHADQTIDVMKKRLDELTADYLKERNENITKAKLEELYDKIATQGQLTNSNNTPAKEAPTQPPIDLKNIEAIVSTKLKEAEIVRKEQTNLDAVKAKLTEQFGTKYQDVVKQQIDTLGLSSEDFHALAKKSPTALYKTLGLDSVTTEGFQAPPRSSQRNDTFAPTGTAKRTWAYYQELKKKDPMLYYDRNTSIQMQKDAVELGAAFRDGDYFRKGLHDE